MRALRLHRTRPFFFAAAALLSLAALGPVSCSGGSASDDEDDDDGSAEGAPEGALQGDCDDGVDNDDDGRVDCADSGCSDTPACDGGSDGTDGSDGSDGADGTDGTSNQPPIADAGDDIVGCSHGRVTLDGTGSYDPDGTIVAWDWDGGGGGSGARPETGVPDTEGSSVTYTLVVTDDDGAESAPDDVVITTNTEPRVTGDSATGDCWRGTVGDDDWRYYYWNDGCDSSCSCSITIDMDEPDDNLQSEWEYFGYAGVTSTSGARVTFGYVNCDRNSAVLSYGDACNDVGEGGRDFSLTMDCY